MSETDIQALLDGLASDLAVPVTLEDTEFRLLAHTDHSGAIDEVRRSMIIGRRVTPEVCAWFEQWGTRDALVPLKTPADKKLGVLERWCVPVRFRGILLGHIWVLGAGKVTEQELAPAVEVAEHLGALLHRRQLGRQADTDLLRLLIIPSAEHDGVAAETLASGIYARKRPVAVVVVGASDTESLTPAALSDLTLAVHRAAEQASSDGVLAGVLAGIGVILAPLANGGDLSPAHRLAEKARGFAAHINHELDVVAAIGGAADVARASDSYAEARRALRVLRAIPDMGPIVAWEDLGVFRALAFLPSGEIESSVVDRRVQELLASQELALTAETFLDLAGNVQETAARLYLHRTTLYQRLDRIAAVYKLDLRRNGDHRLLTHLGLKFARVANPQAP